MATTYSTYTGGFASSSAIYTVPAGKVAKIIITDLQMFANETIQIGSYRRLNSSGSFVESRFGSSASSGSTASYFFETEDIIVARKDAGNLASQCMPIKRTHILVAGENIRFLDVSSNTVSFTVIEEDV